MLNNRMGGGQPRRKSKPLGLAFSVLSSKAVFRALPIFCVAFMATFIASSILTPMNASNAAETTITANISSGSYTLSLTVSPNVTLDLTSAPTGAMTVGSAALSAETNAPTGYKLYMNMTGANASTNELIHTTNSANTISSAGTFTNPVALESGTWGYAIPHSAPSVKSTNGFDASYSTMTSAVPTSSKFAAVPTSSQTPQLIAETNSSNSGNPNQFNIYYGVKADYTVPSGAYTNKVLYTGVADAGAAHQMMVSPIETPSIDGGDTLTLTTTLFSTASTIDADAYILTAEEFAIVNANASAISSYGASKMDCSRDTTKDYLELVCVNIAKPVGHYYVYVDVPDYGEHYSTTIDYVANFWNITYMQDMTAAICNDTKYVTTPSKNVYNGTTFTDSTTHTYPRAEHVDTGAVVTIGGVDINTYRPAHKADTDYVPETTMKDKRKSIFYMDDQGNYVTGTGGGLKEIEVEYTVRKLADGNCWMTDNLALNYEEGREFTSADTNVTSTKTAAHATQSLNGVVQSWEINANIDGQHTCDADTLEANRICWSERDDPNKANDGAYPNRWLSRSTNGAKENTYSAEANQTGENQDIGTYYNWYTATVGSVTDSGTATEDICPKGWKLPANSGNGSWINLIKDTYGIITNNGGTQTDNRGNLTLHKFPFSIPYSGYVVRTTGAFYNQGSEGFFWATEAYSGVGARYLGFVGSNLIPQDGNYKTYGFTVRCLAKSSN